MTQEDKELLLKDLCARLPYGVKVNNEIQGDFVIYGVCENYIFARTTTSHADFRIENIKPYLFPLSSMTEEGILELYKITYDTWYNDSLYYKKEEWIKFRDSIKNNNLCFKTCIWLSDINKVMDCLLKNHFDYRGLIEKGLAIDATGLNIY